MNKGFSDWAKVIAALGFAIALASCGGMSTDGGTGSDTSWLKSCDDNSDCGQGSCLCGVCTVKCTKSSQCGEVAGDAECTATEGLYACDEARAKAPAKICSSESVTARLSVGGEPADAGTAANSASEPKPALSEITAGRADKLDLLFVVDNSNGMAPSQEILKNSVPDLLHRLVSPNCTSADGNFVSSPADPEDACPAGSSREFEPLSDIHIGVITTSLGGYGSPHDCVAEAVVARSEEKVDMAHLLGSLPRGAGDGDFISWDPTMSEAALTEAVTRQISSAGEHGCGWEAPLESWYRFLAEPRPYVQIERVNCSFGGDTQRSCIGPITDTAGLPLVDTTILEQRKNFLRPDSLLGIIMLSNENDCSFRANGQSWRLAQAFVNEFTLNAAFKGTAACAADPNNECCQSCGGPVPAGCPSAMDSGGQQVALGCEVSKRYDISDNGGANLEDQINLRCFEQKRRFGVDYLYPVERYSAALTRPTICPTSDSLDPADCESDQLVTNPLFDDLSFADRKAKDPTAKKAPPRPRSRIFLSGLVGVPWQDLAVDPSAKKQLVYRSSASTSAATKINWDWVIGPRSATIPKPADPLMIESIDPRRGITPATGEQLAPVGAPRMTNSINGHEWNIAERQELQYACITPLPSARTCLSPDSFPNPSVAQPSCECRDFGESSYSNPLCQQADDGYGLTQSFAPAFPGLRQLQVMYDLGERAVPASICAKQVTDANAADYGFRPAMDALIRHVKPQLSE